MVNAQFDYYGSDFDMENMMKLMENCTNIPGEVLKLVNSKVNQSNIFAGLIACFDYMPDPDESTASSHMDLFGEAYLTNECE